MFFSFLLQRNLTAIIVIFLLLSLFVLTSCVNGGNDSIKPPTKKIKLPPEPPLPPDAAPDLFLFDDFTGPEYWPRPLPDLDIRHSCGYIPPSCREMVDDPSGKIVDCWLEHHPDIAETIKWEFTPDHKTKWLSWNEEQKDDLRNAFQAARAWRASGFGAWPGNPFEEPPENKEKPHLSDSEIRTVLDTEQQAWPLFVEQVGMSLAAEIDCWISWSLRDYNERALEQIFNGTLRRYVLDKDDGGFNDSRYSGHIVQGLTPAHPTTIWRFLSAKGIIEDTPRKTIAKSIEWSRNNMAHWFDLELPLAREMRAFWHYHGLPPVSRMIQGTTAQDPDMGTLYPGVHSWTSGCASTSRFFRSVLRVVNIPVQVIIAPQTCGHGIPYFSGEGLYLSHGDDPYSQLFKTSDYRAEDLFVGSDEWERWFPEDAEEVDCSSDGNSNVGRKVIELNALEPSDELVKTYCEDQRNGLSRSDSEVFSIMGRFYSMSELESINFWEKIARRAETSTAFECEQWREER